MECTEFENALADALDRSLLSAEARQHLSACERCARLTHELEVIAGKASQLADSEPAPELWSRIRTQLESEGVIHDDKAKPKTNRRASGKPTVVYSFPTGRPQPR